MSFVTAFAPATVANVGPCFDRAGFAVSEPGDTITAAWNDTNQVVITKITGDGGMLPPDPARNTAGVVASEILRLAGETRGVDLTVHKGMPIFSGLGSSAASAAAAAVAVNRLLDNRFTRPELLPACARGEEVACGMAHFDNVAPSLLGGLTILTGESASVLELPFDITVVLVSPDYRLSTSRSRAAIQSSLTELHAIAEAQTALLTQSQTLADFATVVDSNTLLEQLRGPLIPGFTAARAAGLAAGAFSATISGSGPSIFALTTPATAEKVKTAVQKAFQTDAGLKSQAWITQLDTTGAKIIPNE